MKREGLILLGIAAMPFLASCGAVQTASKTAETVQTVRRVGNAQAMNASVENLKQVALAVTQYSFDYNGRLPPMQNVVALQTAIAPYAMGRSNLLTSPATGWPYALNTKLSGRVRKQIRPANMTVLAYESAPISGPNNPDDLYRVACFVDAHVKAMPEKQWPTYKQASGLP